MKSITFTLDNLIGLYRIINAASIHKVADKLSVLKILRVLKPYVKQFEEYRDDVHSKLKPDDWDERQQRYLNGERNVFADYEKEMQATMTAELKTNVTIEFEPITEETLLSMEYKSITAQTLEELIELLCNK